MRPRELFLSHANADRPFVESLASTLKAHGLKVWHSTKNLKGAQQWHDEIGRALERCDWFAVLLSPASVRSRWVKRELVFAISDKRYDERVVPILVRKCSWKKPFWALVDLQRVDFTAGYDKGCRDLLSVWDIPFDPTRNRPKRRRRRGS
jgi:TIR domain-containing protein